MKRITQFFGAALAALFLCLPAKADSGHVIYDNYLPFNPVAVYGTTVSIRTDGINWVSAQVVATSATVPAGSFTDGSASSATITVASYLALSSATATGTITVVTNSATSGGTISGGGPQVGSFSISNPLQWQTDPVASSGTACSIASALDSYTMVVATCTWGQATGVVFTTAPYYGAVWDSFNINSSTPALTISQLTGGQDNQSLTVNGTTLLANRDFYPKTSTTVTAAAIAAAINKSSTTTGVVAGNASAVISASSTVVGLNTNYTLISSSQNALTLSPPVTIIQPSATSTMFGGAASAYLIGTSTISIPGNIFGTGQQVVYSTGTGVTIAPLIPGTTYFVIDIPPTTIGPFIMLSLTSTGAIAGLPIVLTSSTTTPAGGDTFTLTPEAISGTPSIQWVVSNDNANWLPIITTPMGQTIVPKATYGSYFSTGTVNWWDFGHMDYSYLGVNYGAPATGGMVIKARVVGKGD